jgi:hypothetical protein
MRSEKEISSIIKTCELLDLDGLVFVGASHTLTDALYLANTFIEKSKANLLIFKSVLPRNLGIVKVVIGE